MYVKFAHRGKRSQSSFFCRKSGPGTNGAGSASEPARKKKPRVRIRTQVYKEKKARERTAALAFSQWLQQSSIPEDAFIPTSKELCDWEPIRTLISNLPVEETMSRDAFINVMNEGREFLESYDFKIKVRLVSQVLASQTSLTPDPPTIEDFGKLHLATSVFSCSEGKLRDGPSLHWIDQEYRRVPPYPASSHGFHLSLLRRNH
ncbi:hypothetical protein M407DRAFT_235406 [Tulasnella calospora MUT 4182]|uniref:Uncharacterized protein n=1 Tax=Tulasnella calospora MUT 4182 TaxID=1051891 RepID=A0A0C3L2B9_9AGAM|nr:hypothetical protein M407DRAFT_235406 [Tulasnella calospora MUT 4182]